MQLVRIVPSLFLSAMILGGCGGGKKPPQLQVSKPAPIQVPVPATPASSDLWGYAKLRDPLGLAQKIFGPMTQPMLLSLGLGPNDLKPGSSAALYVWDPEGQPLMAAPSALMLPFPAESERIAELSRAFAGTQALPIPSGTLFLLNPAAQAKAKTQKDAILQLGAAQSPFDVTVYAYLDPILKKHGPALRETLNKVGESVAVNGQNAALPGTGDSIKKLYSNLVDSLIELKSATLAANLTDRALELSLISENKAPASKTEPYAVPDLLSFLPPSHLRLQWNTRDMQRFVDFYLKTYAPMFESQPPIKEAMQKSLSEWSKAVQKISMAMSVTVGGDKYIQMSSIMKVEDGKAALSAMRTGFQILMSPKVKESWDKLGISMTSKVSQGARKLHGWPVDSYEYSYQVTKPEMQTAKQMFDKFSNLKMEVVQVGNYLVFAMGGSVDQAVNALMTGKPEFPVEAMKRFPAGAAVYADIDLKRIAATVEKMMGRPLAIPLPQGAEVVSAASFEGSAASQHQLFVPKALVDLGIGALMSAVQTRSRSNDDFGYDPAGPMGPPPGAPPP
ncbi:MAG: hypothetical protein U0787_01555 [Polyangia bacterium]